MKLPLAYYPDPILKRKCERVNHIDDELRQLVSNMLETMHAYRGIGLAAPQIFQPLTLFVNCIPYQSAEGKWFRGRNKVYINPELKSHSAETEPSEEGCLSIPNLSVVVQRPVSIQIEATDMNGHRFQETLVGLPAINFMHETDHLHGILTLDYLSEEERKQLEEKIKENSNQPTN